MRLRTQFGKVAGHALAAAIFITFLASLLVTPSPAQVLSSGASPIALRAVIPESLTLTLSSSAVNFTLAAGRANNPGSTSITATTSWVLNRSVGRVAVFAFFGSSIAALTDGAGNNIPSADFEISTPSGRRLRSESVAKAYWRKPCRTRELFPIDMAVADYDRTVARMAELFGLRVLEYSAQTDPAIGRRGGMTWIGDGSIELGEPIVEGAPPDRFVRRTGGGMHGVAVWVVYGMGLTRASAHAVVRLFSTPAQVLGTTSVLSAVLLALFGVMFGGSVQAAFERVWSLPAGPWHKIWRQAVWLVALIAYIYAAATVGALTSSASAETVSRVSVALVLGIVFFWWGLRFLLGGRVSYLAAMPGAVATVAFLVGLRVFSSLVFEPLIATNAVTYGAVGTVLILQSWLIGVGWVIYGGQLFGRWFYDGWLRVRADSRRVPGEPGGEQGEQTPGDQ